MSTPVKVQELLAPMRERQVDLAARRFKVDREKIVTHMLKTSLAPRPASPVYGRALGTLALAAGLALAVWAGVRWTQGRAASDEFEVVALRGEVVRVQGEARSGLARGQTALVGADGSIETSSNSEANIKTASGFEIQLLEKTRVSLKEMRVQGGASALRLSAGRVRCVIPHLPDGQSFSVVTPDVTVVDRGTIFSVSVQQTPTGARTAVHVEEGVVEVQHVTGQVRLTANESWVSASPAQQPASAASVVEPEAASSAEAPSGPVAGTASPKRAKNLPETLGNETQLLRSGLASERKGDLRGAASAFESLLSRYPGSPLAPDARAALARVKGSLGN